MKPQCDHKRDWIHKLELQTKETETILRQQVYQSHEHNADQQK